MPKDTANRSAFPVVFIFMNLMAVPAFADVVQWYGGGIVKFNKGFDQSDLEQGTPVVWSMEYDDTSFSIDPEIPEPRLPKIPVLFTLVWKDQKLVIGDMDGTRKSKVPAETKLTVWDFDTRDIINFSIELDEENSATLPGDDLAIAGVTFRIHGPPSMLFSDRAANIRHANFMWGADGFMPFIYIYGKDTDADGKRKNTVWIDIRSLSDSIPKNGNKDVVEQTLSTDSPTGKSHPPVTITTTDSGETLVSFTAHQASLIKGIKPSLEQSDDLLVWKPIPEEWQEQHVVDLGNGFQTHSFLNGNGIKGSVPERCFFRVRLDRIDHEPLGE